MAISVQCPTKRYIVILFQPVTLTCNFQASTSQPPVVTWKYKSYCRDPIQAALNPSSSENILSQNNPNYDPNLQCADSQRDVRSVVSKQGNGVSLSPEYQGRKISVLNGELIKAYFLHFKQLNYVFEQVGCLIASQASKKISVILIILFVLKTLVVSCP